MTAVWLKNAYLLKDLLNQHSPQQVTDLYSKLFSIIFNLWQKLQASNWNIIMIWSIKYFNLFWWRMWGAARSWCLWWRTCRSVSERSVICVFRPISSFCPSLRAIYNLWSVHSYRQKDLSYRSVNDLDCVLISLLQSQQCLKVRPSLVWLVHLWRVWAASERVRTPGLPPAQRGPLCQQSWGNCQHYTQPYPVRICPRPCWNKPSVSSCTCCPPPPSTACYCAKTCAAGTAASRSGLLLQHL